MMVDSGSVAFNGGPSGGLYYSASQTVSYPSGINLKKAFVQVTPRADPGVYTAWVKAINETNFIYAIARTSNATATMYNQILVVGWLAN